MAENDYSKLNLSSVSTPVDDLLMIYHFCDMKCFIKLYLIPFNLLLFRFQRQILHLRERCLQ